LLRRRLIAIDRLLGRRLFGTGLLRRLSAAGLFGLPTEAKPRVATGNRRLRVGIGPWSGLILPRERCARSERQNGHRQQVLPQFHSDAFRGK
jgi:hypothetical protein